MRLSGRHPSCGFTGGVARFHPSGHSIGLSGALDESLPLLIRSSSSSSSSPFPTTTEAKSLLSNSLLSLFLHDGPFVVSCLANDRDNDSSGDDNNDSSPTGGDGEVGEEENNDPSDTLVARERENGEDADDEDPADVNEREDEQEEDPADVNEEIQRPESIPSDGKDISLNIEEIDEEEIADQQITCLRYYHQNETTGQDTGTLIVKRISADTGQVIPGGLFRITPNPYGLDSSLIISDKESTEKFDCSVVGDGMIVLEDVPFSPYNIQEMRHQPDFSSSNFFVVHESDIYVHENLASPCIVGIHLLL